MSSRFLAYLALSAPAVVNAQQLANAISSRFPSVPMTVRPVKTGTRSIEHSFLLAIDETVLTIMLIDQPLPRDSYESALELDRLWPEARQVMAGHGAHIIAATLNEPKSHSEAINAAAGLTFAIASLSEMTDTKAVIWSNAETITEPEQFQLAAQGVAKRQIPIDIWAGLRWLDGPPKADGARTLAVLTSGLLPFIGREIEFMPAPMSAYEIGKRVVGLCDYLIRNGPVIGDGETVGLTTDEHIRVRFADQGQRPQVPVLQMTVKTIEAGPGPSDSKVTHAPARTNGVPNAVSGKSNPR